MTFHKTEMAVWSLIVAMTAATASLMVSSGLSFDWTSAPRPLIPCLGCLAGALLYRTWRPSERLATTLVAVAQLLAFTAVAETFSYAIASMGWPLWDERFLSWDKALGLDWRAYVDFVEAHPTLSLVFSLAYRSLILQVAFLAAALGLTGRCADCRIFVFAAALSCVVTVVLSGFMPAVSAFVHLGLHADAFPNIDSSGAYAPLGPFYALRAGSLRLISLSHGEGIIAFPSFHAALGVIFIRMYWTIAWARWPALALNAVLMVATPINGGHYFVDVFAGALIAISAVAAARKLDQAAERADDSDIAVIAPAGVAPA